LAVEVLPVLLIINILRVEGIITGLEAHRLHRIVFFMISLLTIPLIIAILQEEAAGILAVAVATVAVVAHSVRLQSLHPLLRIREEPLTYLSLKDK